MAEGADALMVKPALWYLDLIGKVRARTLLPVMAYNFQQSVRLLAESVRSFTDHCAAGIVANCDKMKRNLDQSLMLVTALNPWIGYENAAKTSHLAYEENISLKEACVKLGFMTSEEFDKVFHPEQMI